MSIQIRRNNLILVPPVQSVITPPTAEEIALLKSPHLRAWWRPDVDWGKDGINWYDRKNGYAAALESGAMPTLVTSGGTANKPYLQWPVNGAVLSAPATQSLWPVAGDYTLVFVAQAAAAKSGAVLANHRSTSSDNGLAFFGYSYSTQQAATYINATHQSANGAFATTGAGAYTDTVMAVLSYDFAAKDGIIRVNNAQVTSNLDVPNQPQSPQLCIGGGYDGTAAAFTTWSGRFYDALIFNQALHKPNLATTLAQLEAYARLRYGLWTSP